MSTPAASQQAANDGGSGLVLYAQAAVPAELPPLPDYRRPPGIPRIRNRRSALYVRDTQQKGTGQVSYNFLLQSWARQANELNQVSLHTEGWNVQFFQSRPVLWSFTGILFDGPNDYDWSNEFISFYDDYLKGSRSSGRYEVSVLFAGRIVQGFMTGLELSGSVPFDTSVRFVLRMLAVSEEVVPDAQVADDPSTVTVALDFRPGGVGGVGSLA